MLSYSKVRNMDRMTVGLGGRVVLALSLTALMAVGRFETYHHPLELAVARELPASRYVSVIEGLSLFNVRVDVVRSGQPGYQSRI